MLGWWRSNFTFPCLLNTHTPPPTHTHTPPIRVKGFQLVLDMQDFRLEHVFFLLEKGEGLFLTAWTRISSRDKDLCILCMCVAGDEIRHQGGHSWASGPPHALRLTHIDRSLSHLSAEGIFISEIAWLVPNRSGGYFNHPRGNRKRYDVLWVCVLLCV